jgi:hypothetical protein
VVAPDVQVSFETAKSPEFVPVMEAADALKETPVGLFRVTVSGVLLLPTATAPKLKADGETRMFVAHALRFTTCGLRKPPLDGVIVSAPVIGPDTIPPAEAALKVRSVLQFAAGLRLGPQVVLPRVKPPLGVMVKPSEAASWFASVTV